MTAAVDPRPAGTEGDQTQADRARDLYRAFPYADAASIDSLSAICSIMSVPGGGPLLLEGEQSEAIYIVVSGLLAADRPAPQRQPAALDRYAAGDVIGDIGLITGEARRGAIRAVRNSELLRLSKQELQTAAAGCPNVLLVICSGIVQRLQRAQTAPAKPRASGTFCIVPADNTIDIKSVIRQIATALAVFGSVAIMAAEQMSERTFTCFSEVEAHADFVLLEADCDRTAWTRFCLRQCDRIILLAQGDAEPADRLELGRAREALPHDTPLSLILRWHQSIVPVRTTAWLAMVQPNLHHHVRSSRDLERASRLIAGRGRGLVLSGGGAKGLAHIGVIEVPKEHDIEIDAVGGTSIGGIVAAVLALEWDPAATVRALAASFNSRRFSDFAVPRTALFSERAFARTLGHCFGDRAIEDTPIPLFCVSTNLTEGIANVHRTGRLVTWLRATSAVPGICPRIVEKNAIHVDGGVLNNLPVDVIRDFGVASVIAVDVGSSLATQARLDGINSLPNIVDLLWRVGSIGSDVIGNRAVCDDDVVLKPDVGILGRFDWNAHEPAIAAGRRAALDNLSAIRAALSPSPG